MARGGGPGAEAPGPPGPPGAPAGPAEVSRRRRGASGLPAPGSPVPQRFDQRGHVTPVLGCQLVDAGDQEFPLLVAWMLLPGGGLVVVVQSGGLGGGGADGGDRHVEAFGERVDRGRARRPGQVPGRGEGVEGGPGQAAAAWRPRRRTSPARAAAAGSAAAAG